MENKKPKHYVTNANLMKELRIFHESGTITEELAIMLMEIAKKFTNRHDWNGYPEDMKKDLASEAVLRMISQIHKFDMNRLSYSVKLENPYKDKKSGKLIEYENIAVSLKNNEIMEINGKKYKRENYELVNVNDSKDVYKLSKPNPFAYFSQICFHKYIMEAKKYYKQINIQRDMCERYIEEIECNEHMDSNGFLKKALNERVNELG